MVCLVSPSAVSRSVNLALFTTPSFNSPNEAVAVAHPFEAGAMVMFRLDEALRL